MLCQYRTYHYMLCQYQGPCPMPVLRIAYSVFVHAMPVAHSSNLRPPYAISVQHIARTPSVPRIPQRARTPIRYLCTGHRVASA
eukprot:2719518-Rhodomonas_salina.2